MNALYQNGRRSGTRALDCRLRTRAADAGMAWRSGEHGGFHGLGLDGRPARAHRGIVGGGHSLGWFYVVLYSPVYKYKYKYKYKILLHIPTYNRVKCI